MSSDASPRLFEPLTLRGLTLPNRVFLPPMCQYQAVDGVVTAWHLQHYAARAAGGFGLIIAEATAVTPEGRLSPRDAGLWNDEQLLAWQEITATAHALGGRIGVQLGHGGRKAGAHPWLPGAGDGSLTEAEGGWETVAPSPIAFPGYATPRELTLEEIRAIPQDFALAAQRAVEAGFDAVEIHGAHGYLMHQFLSPLSNERTDEYGGSFDNRTRLLRETATAIRQVIPRTMPLLVRISATDWLEGGWDVEQSTRLAASLTGVVDFWDISSGALLPAEIPLGPGYQVDLATTVRSAGTPVGAVGSLDDPALAESVITEGRADAVFIGRAALANPNWPLVAAARLGAPHPAVADSYWRAQRHFLG